MMIGWRELAAYTPDDTSWITLRSIVMWLARSISTPWVLGSPGEPHGPISESRIVTWLTPLITMHEPRVVVTCRFSMTCPSLATICPLTGLPLMVAGVGIAPFDEVFAPAGAARSESVAVGGAACAVPVSEQPASTTDAIPHTAATPITEVVAATPPRISISNAARMTLRSAVPHEAHGAILTHLAWHGWPGAFSGSDC